VTTIGTSPLADADPMSTPSRLPTYFISHGGGPWPWMDDRRVMFAALADSLEQLTREIGVRPKAVLSVSGHWEEPAFTAMASPRPPMVYDYYGFPAHTYSVQYPAPGAPDVAHRIAGLLREAQLPTGVDAERGFDHGTFAPLVVMYPEADVPVLQLSLHQSYDPALHLAAGRALAPLRDEGVLILGSGLSFHNLRMRGPGAIAPSKAFDAWLHDTLEGLPPAERSARLLEWEQAPAARIAHPAEDHLLPLMVAVGAAEQEAAHTLYHEDGVLGGWTVSSFRFGDLPA
jgi:aromatic ring-opening dioxygenase catalytic subunit (LigB family)